MDGVKQNMEYSLKNDLLMTIISFNCKSLKRSAAYVRDLCEASDIVLLQETWLLPHDLGSINSIHEEFLGTANSAVDTSQGLLRGRPYGGLAILWRKDRFPNVSVVQCNNTKISALCLHVGLRTILIINVYMPCDDSEIESFTEYVSCLGYINAIIEENNVQAVFILGDFNAHPTTRFGRELLKFCADHFLHCADIELLGIDSETFTFVSEAHGSQRWLDHCLTTNEAWDSIVSVNVVQNVSWSDHMPLRLICNIENVCEKVVKKSFVQFDGVRWGNRNACQRKKIL